MADARMIRCDRFGHRQAIHILLQCTHALQRNAMRLAEPETPSVLNWLGLTFPIQSCPQAELSIDRYKKVQSPNIEPYLIVTQSAP